MELESIFKNTAASFNKGEKIATDFRPWKMIIIFHTGHSHKTNSGDS